MNQDKIEKIRKLIKKAEGTTNAHEASAFMAKAQQMMDAEGVDMAAVDMAAIGEARVKSLFSASKPSMYEATLMQAVCEAFGCKLLWISMKTSEKTPYGRVRYSDTYGRYVFVGAKDRLGLATYAAEVLVRQMKKARVEFVTQRTEHYYEHAMAGERFDAEDRMMIRKDKEIRRTIRKQVTKDADSFLCGWAYEIRKKIVKFALNDKELLLIEQKTAGIGEGNVKKTKPNMNFYKGVEAAKDANLHRPLDEAGLTTQMIGAK